jgi:retron-type reverse transcriptase
MRDAATVLGIIHERGKHGLPLEDIYRQLYNPQLYLRAYDRLRTNKGAMTPGTTGETVDGMSLEKIQAIIEAVRFERYRWTPVKRVYIPKKRSRKLRPLGLPTWSDKLLGESSAPFWKRITNHSSATSPTASRPTGAATRR